MSLKPGYKLLHNEIVEKSPEGEVIRVRFKAVSAVETPQAMDELIRSYASD